MKVVISSGHGKYVRGASGYLDEVDEARRVVERVADELRARKVEVETFHDDTSTSQDENLNRIVEFHNAQARDLDVSVHFNASETTSEPMGCEVLYVTQGEFAATISAAIARAGGLPDRGPKYRDDLFFLNNTEQPSILIETCFVDSSADAGLYEQAFGPICLAIADVIAGPKDRSKPMAEPLASFAGTCSWFGGPDDSGVAPDEGLAFIDDVDTAPHLFLAEQPEGTTGLARRLDPDIYYVACRWDYDTTPKDMLAESGQRALVIAKKTGKKFKAWPADWGPHEDTGRAADISPGLMEALEIATDDEVEVIYPAPKAKAKRKEKRHASRKSSTTRGHVRRSGGKKHVGNPKKSRNGVRKKRQAGKASRTQKRGKGRTKKR
jgi:N-acetylmuramoyl-L-alanine amidase